MRLARANLMKRFLILIGLLLALVPGGRAAWAHAVLLETSPGNGAVLDRVPREIVLRFNEPVAPISLALVGRAGQSTIPADAITARDAELHATITDELRPGSYIVSYRVVSADSHPVSGAFLFAVGNPSGAAPTAPDLHEQENTWAFLVIVNRIVLLAGLLFTAGGVLFAVGVLGGEPARTAPLRRPLRIAAVITTASAILAIALQGGLLTAASLDSDVLWHNGAILTAGWHSTLGTSAALIALGMLMVTLSFGRSQRHWIWLSTAGAILAAGALAASGHAANAPPRWLATPAMAAHSLVIAFWAGSLWPMLRILQRHGVEAAGVVVRFSRAAMVAVAILMVSGVMLAMLQLGGDVTALVTTPYGVLLVLKLAVVALLLLLATYNKVRLTPGLLRGEPAASERLSRAIRLEIGAIILILTVTALLGQAPPPRALATLERSASSPHGSHGAAADPSVRIQDKGYTAVISVTPARPGRNSVTVTLQGPDGAPFAALEANGEISLPAAGIEPLAHPLEPLAPGRYQWSTDGFIRPGLWQFRLGVLINDFELANFDTTIPIRD